MVVAARDSPTSLSGVLGPIKSSGGEGKRRTQGHIVKSPSLLNCLLAWFLEGGLEDNSPALSLGSQRNRH